MNKYDNEYYIVSRLAGDNQIFIKPDEKTAKRKYHYKKLIHGEPPLCFENGFRDEDQNKWEITDVLVDSSGMILREEIKNLLGDLKVKGMQVYPAIYIDDDDKWHDDFWYLGFYEELDCVDRDKSTIVEFDDDDDEDELLEIEKFSLKEQVLDAIPEAQRLLFKIGECSKDYVFVHKNIVDIFAQKKCSGIRFFRVSDFTEGDQHKL